MMRVAAVVLAGGRGERLGGVNKALLRLGSETFLDRALAATEGCTPGLVSVGRVDWRSDRRIEAVLDLPTDYAGPLAGVAAAVDRLADAPPDALFTIAVDTPLFPRDFLQRALPLLETSQAVVASYAGQDYPTNAVWRFDAILSLAENVRNGTAPHSLKRLAELLSTARLDYASWFPFDPFRNANTPEDLEFLRLQADRLGSG